LNPPPYESPFTYPKSRKPTRPRCGQQIYRALKLTSLLILMVLLVAVMVYGGKRADVDEHERSSREKKRWYNESITFVTLHYEECRCIMHTATCASGSYALNNSFVGPKEVPCFRPYEVNTGWEFRSRESLLHHLFPVMHGEGGVSPWAGLVIVAILVFICTCIGLIQSLRKG
jgi:hypothetical protein